MKYAILQVSDGNNNIVEEGFTDVNDAKKRWHHHCEALFADNSYSLACIKIIDENLDSVEGSKYTELIDRRPTPEPVV